MKQLTLEAFSRPLQAMLNARLKQTNPLGGQLEEDLPFLSSSWAEKGCSDADILAVVQRFASFFCVPDTVSVSPVTPSEPIRRFTEYAYAAWLSGARNVAFQTSGSTGIPKTCVHHETDLLQELDGVLPLVQRTKRVLLCVPPYHLFGFTTGVMLPHRMSVPVMPVPMLPTVVTAAMRPGDLLAGIPLLWNMMLRGTLPDRHGITLLTATAPMPDKLFAALRHKGFRLVENFGSSETGVLGFRSQEQTPFTLAPQFADVSGTNAAFVKRTMPNGTTRVYPLQDGFLWSDSRHFSPQGRIDKAVMVGGLNVYPERIAGQLKTIAGVRECVVRLSEAQGADRLKAFIVTEPSIDRKVLLAQLYAFAKDHLNSVEQPISYTFGDALPINDMGKRTDWE